MAAFCLLSMSSAYSVYRCVYISRMDGSLHSSPHPGLCTYRKRAVTPAGNRDEGLTARMHDTYTQTHTYTHTRLRYHSRIEFVRNPGLSMADCFPSMKIFESSRVYIRSVLCIHAITDITGIAMMSVLRHPRYFAYRDSHFSPVTSQENR